MTITLVNLRYPYGAKQVYLNHSLVSVASRIISINPNAKIKFVDFNIDEYDDLKYTFEESDALGISLLGAPYIPEAIKFVWKIEKDFPKKQVAIGGQVIEHISQEAFSQIFCDLAVKQIIDDNDFADWLGLEKNIPHPLDISCQPGWEKIESERLRLYMQREMTLEVSQGCGFNCKFCAAHKGCKERLKNITVFESDLQYLTGRAQEFGLESLKFYASALDFFQNPDEKEKLLRILSRIRKESGINIQVRCLTCMSTFLYSTKMSDLSDLIQEAGIWCIGFGVDGADETVWHREGKKHNRLHQVQECINLCHKMREWRVPLF